MSTIQQTETMMSLETFDKAVPDVMLQIIYAMRFEIIFAGGFLLLWVMGQCARPRQSSSAARAAYKTKQLGMDDDFDSAPRPKSLSSARARNATPANTSESGISAQRQSPPIQKDLVALIHGQPEPCQLRDISWLFPKLIQLCQTQAQRAVFLYHSALDANLDLNKAPEQEREQLILALVTSMIRMSLTPEAMKILRDLKKREIPISHGIITSCIKLCTSKHSFKECIAIADLVTDMGKELASDKSVLSCLLFSALESGAYHRCQGFFIELRKIGAPTQKDFWNMIRCGSHQCDWRLLLNLIQEMRALGIEVDNVIYNTVLATCVSANQMGEAQVLLDEMAKSEGVADVITYNTLMKGYSKIGKMDCCFKLYELMRERGIIPSQVTYGILLDGYISDNEIDGAAKVFDIMTEEGCPMNTVLYTTLIKGFAREGKVDEAMRVYGKMSGDKHVAPDLITFSILSKANCDVGRLEVALALLNDMPKIGLHPDEVIFNNLLAGCAKDMRADLAKELYDKMIQSNVKPSNATFSIMIRLYSQCKMLDEAVDMVRIEPKKHRVALEPRLFSQLIQCCIRARQGRRAVDVYELVYHLSKPDAGMLNSIIGMCVKLNMFDTAAEFLEVAAKHGGSVDVADAKFLLEAACRKKKTVCADSVVASMRALGMPLLDH